MKNIQSLSLTIKKNAYLATAFQVLFAIGLASVSFGSNASATGQLLNRSLEMSDSAVSGTSITSGVGSGTKVVYKLTFDPSATANVGAIIIDFCSNSAIPGDTCTAPTGFNTNYATLSANNQTNLGAGSFSVVTSGTGVTLSTASRVVLSRGTATAPTTGATLALGDGSANGITNPSGTPGTFYARIYTYAANPAAFTSTSIGTPIDIGGVALSTANVITITARVQEQLIFCVSGAAPTSNCGGTSAPALAIGHTVGGGTQPIIDSSAVNSGSVYSQISTNADHGAAVRMHTSTSCGGLSNDGGASCDIPPVGSGAATASTMTAGTSAFGLQVGAVTGSTVAAPYNGTGTSYGLDSTTAGANATTTFGSQVYSVPGPVSNMGHTWTFGATAANTTPAGLYSANISVIATGQF